MSSRCVSAVASGARLFRVLAVAVLLGGCATGPPRMSLTSGFGLHSRPTFRRDASGPGPRVATAPLGEAAGAAGGFPEQTRDFFQAVQEASGLGVEVRHPAGAALYLEQARQLLARVAKTPVTQRSFAPRQALCWLLREVLEGGEHVDYADLKWRAERFGSVVLVRPDGYLVTALDGTPLQRLGPLELVEGEWRVGRLVVGGFYVSHGGIFYPATEALRRADGPPLAELGLGRDPLNAALDGGQQALAEMALALAHTVLHPIRTLEDLGQLPTTLAHLIASSPEYFARYGAMSREDQIREAARLSTHLLLLLGGAKATVGRMGRLGAELPVLSVTAEGELVLGGAVVAMGATMDLGALSILHMAGKGGGRSGGASGKAGKASQTAPAKNPGRWTYKKPTTESKRSLDYQEQVTGRPAWWVYMVGKLEFDGFKLGELLEAKGPGYCSFFEANGTPKTWFEASGGFEQLKVQARRQSKAAQGLGLPVSWHVADANVAKFLRQLFKKEKWNNITVHHRPPAQ